MDRINYHKSGHKMDYSEIDKKFEKYYDSGERVEVTWKKGYEDYSGYGCKSKGMKARFYVGKSTGWKPIFIQVYSRVSRGGQSILSSAVESIRGLGIYR